MVNKKMWGIVVVLLTITIGLAIAQQSSFQLGTYTWAGFRDPPSKLQTLIFRNDGSVVAKDSSGKVILSGFYKVTRNAVKLDWDFRGSAAAKAEINLTLFIEGNTLTFGNGHWRRTGN